MPEMANYGRFVDGCGFRDSLLGAAQGVSRLVDTAVEIVSSRTLADEKILNSYMAIFYFMYAFRGGKEILDFLKENPFLIPLVAEAYDNLQEYFPDSTIFMEVDQDDLVISVGTTLSPEEAIEKLDEFDEKWWFDACIASRAKLCITVEYQ